jgi:hypothetical protein
MALDRHDPEKARFFIILLFDLGLLNDHPRISEKRDAGRFAVVAKEHTRSQPLPDPVSRRAGSETRNKDAAWLEPFCDQLEQIALFRSRDMGDGIKSSNRVEAFWIESYRGHIGLNKFRFRDVCSGAVDLLCRNIHTGDGKTAISQLPSNRDACAATEIEHIAAVGRHFLYQAVEPFFPHGG